MIVDYPEQSFLFKFNSFSKRCSCATSGIISYTKLVFISSFAYGSVYEECLDLWKAIVIDEFQDTSVMQYNFLRILASHKRITIVGDEDQSIFSFNGADVSGFESFRKDFPNYKEVLLMFILL
ncbi:hypothetical protein GIB67_021596 [Kingdonia uniflora]|uniref:UvrD-like helicase ATP-binding domain-containing protein n=1 Tax=Kingdonia uniflora TaxID=39325 RepID=A0A7J7MDP6_9MAGN|nr:hypothetical protein GIB67_021596 [Kingdonia uniflora]